MRQHFKQIAKKNEKSAFLIDTYRKTDPAKRSNFVQ
jgi:hypothetical protein